MKIVTYVLNSASFFDKIDALKQAVAKKTVATSPSERSHIKDFDDHRNGTIEYYKLPLSEQ